MERKSWTIKDEAVLEELLELMNVSEEEKNALAQAQPEAQTVAPQMADEFYTRILSHPHTREYVEGMVDRLKNTLQQWFLDLFSGQYGQEYVKSRLKIGHIHVRIGLPVRYPLMMFDIILKYGEQAAARSPTPELSTMAFRKVCALDMAIFNHAYEEEQLNHLAAMVGNERLARRLLTQKPNE